MKIALQKLHLCMFYVDICIKLKISPINVISQTHSFKINKLININIFNINCRSHFFVYSTILQNGL